jgi:acetoin utilization deacetylase AcuC-like enzyme
VAGEVSLDADTHMSPGSLEAALHAVGAGIAAVDQVLDGQAEAVFVAARPPGHHAEPDRAMGFCLFNTVAIAAMHAIAARGLNRAAVVDVDVHHGNGTQAFAETEPRLSFTSLHQGWIYPGTGAAYETGRHGNILNIPFEAGTGPEVWLERFDADVVPKLERDAPDILLVSAGFDAHVDDPLAGLALDDAAYGQIGERLAGAARQFSHSRLVCVLEGGYDCPALERSVTSFLRGLQAV